MSAKTSAPKKPVLIPPQYHEQSIATPKKRKAAWKIGVFLLGLLALLLFSVNKGWIVAAVVNGRPIFSWHVYNTLRNRYGQQTIEGLIGEELITSQARTQGVNVTDKEVQEKQKEVLSSLGENVNLDEFLKFQGLTKEDFIHQLKIQLLVERLLTKDLTVSDADIEAYIASNAAYLSATDPGALKAEAKAAIINNTVSEKLQSWFSQLREKAAVMKFMN